MSFKVFIFFWANFFLWENCLFLRICAEIPTSELFMTTGSTKSNYWTYKVNSDFRSCITSSRLCGRKSNLLCLSISETSDSARFFPAVLASMAFSLSVEEAELFLIQQRISLNSFLKLSFSHPYSKGFEHAVNEIWKRKWKKLLRKTKSCRTWAHACHVTSSINYVDCLRAFNYS